MHVFGIHLSQQMLQMATIYRIQRYVVFLRFTFSFLFIHFERNFQRVAPHPPPTFLADVADVPMARDRRGIAMEY